MKCYPQFYRSITSTGRKTLVHTPLEKSTHKHTVGRHSHNSSVRSNLMQANYVTTYQILDHTQLYKDLTYQSDAAKQVVQFLTKLHKAKYHTPQGSYQVYAIKKPSPWQGGKPYYQAAEHHARASYPSRPQRAGRRGTGPWSTRYQARATRSISARSARLSSCQTRKALTRTRRHLAAHGTIPNRSSRSHR